MEIKFDKFLNEYGGPGKAVGFRYSEPSIDYKFSIHLLINPSLRPIIVKNGIKKVFKEEKVGEDLITLNHVGKDEHILTIKMKGYSKFELMSMIDLLFKKVKEIFKDDIEFIIESIELFGSDIYEEEPKRQVGFHKG